MSASEKTKRRQHEWYLKNRERIIARTMEKQNGNHEAYLEYQRRHREENADEYRAKSRAWKAQNRERHLESSRRYSREHKEEISLKRKAARRELKRAVLDAYGGKCECCGESTFEFLTLDHVNGDGAAHRRELKIDKGRSHKLYKHLSEEGFPPGFRVLCFNCNSARGFYGYCPHAPDDARGIPPTRRKAEV